MYMQSDVEPRGERFKQDLRDKFGRAADGLRDTYERAGSHAHEFSRVAGRRSRDAALATVAQVRRRPAPFGLAALVGVAAVALWLSPRLRADVIDGAGRLWNEVQKHKGSLRF